MWQPTTRDLHVAFFETPKRGLAGSVNDSSVFVFCIAQTKR